MSTQPNLFQRLPTPQRIGVTPARLAMLDVIAMNDGAAPLAPLAQPSRQVLRKLLADKLIECIALGPARYRLTPIGRVVRGRKR